METRRVTGTVFGLRLYEIQFAQACQWDEVEGASTMESNVAVRLLVHYERAEQVSAGYRQSLYRDLSRTCIRSRHKKLVSCRDLLVVLGTSTVEYNDV